MSLSTVLQTLRPDGADWCAEVAEHWLQGRSLFGGIQAALAVPAMRALLPAPLPLRTLQTTFIAPVPAGTVRIRPRLLRTGKSTAHVEAQLVDGDQVLCSLLGVFGAARTSSVQRQPPRRPVPADPVIEIRNDVGALPSFLRHFSVRWLQGALPYSGIEAPRALLEVSMDDPGPATEEHVVMLADVPPPLALSQLRVPTPGSSMTWLLEFLAAPLHPLPLSNWRLDTELIAGGDGYTSQSVTVWGPHDRAVALGHQSMVIFG